MQSHNDLIGIVAQLYHSAMLALIGAIIAIGKYLSEPQEWQWSVVFGRALCSGGIAMSAGVALVWVPDLPLIGQFGIAAALASVGVSGVEALLSRIVGGR